MRTKRLLLSTLLSFCLVSQFTLPLFAQEDGNEEIEEIEIEDEEEVMEEMIEVDNEESGSCGENAYWTISYSTLYIYGEGKMDNYKYSSPEYDTMNITKIVIDPGITEIGSYAFEGCENVSQVSIPSTVTYIGEYAFAACSKLSSITIPEGVIFIDSYAFVGCENLTKIFLPQSLEAISDNPFDCLNFEYLYYPGSEDEWRNLLFQEETDMLILKKQMIFGKGTCSSSVSWTLDQNGLLKISGSGEIPDCTINSNGFTSASYARYNGYTFITDIEIDPQITRIGNNAFYNLWAVSNLEIPGSITSIGNSAFVQMNSLESMIIPSSVTSIGNGAFSGLNLSYVYLYKNSFADQYLSSDYNKYYLDSDDKVKGYKVLINEQIDLIFMVNLSSSSLQDTTTHMEFTFENGKKNSAKGIFDSITNSYFYSCEISAKEMTENITAQLVNSSGTVLSKTYSLEQYVKDLLKMGNEDGVSEVDKNYAKALLTFGYYTQKYFNYNTKKMPSIVESIDGIDLNKYASGYLLEDHNEQLNFVGARLFLGHIPTVKLYFKGEGYFTINDKEVATTKEGIYTVITYTSDYSSLEYFTVKSKNFKLIYRAAYYGKIAENKGLTDLSNLVKAHYFLHNARKTYDNPYWEYFEGLQ